MTTTAPAPRLMAPSRDDVLSNLSFFFGEPVSPEKLKEMFVQSLPTAKEMAHPNMKENPELLPQIVKAQQNPLARHRMLQRLLLLLLPLFFPPLLQ